MSSILKALKRVEEETAETEGQPVAAKKDSMLEKTMPEPIERLLLFGGKIAIICIVGYALFWLFTYFNMDISPSSHPQRVSTEPVDMKVPSPPPDTAHPQLNQKTPSAPKESVPPPSGEHPDDIIPDAEKSISKVTDIKDREKAAYSSPMESDDEKLIDANWLSLQALSWQKDPKRRIAVINGKIVKEGSAVDRGMVVRIRPDAVVIQSQGKSYLLQFQNR